MNTTHLFWRQPPTLELSPRQVAEEIKFGSEIEGLIDLPIRDIVDQLRQQIPGGVERAGTVVWRIDGGSLEITWTWQYLSATINDLSAETIETLHEVLASHHAPPYDTTTGIRAS